MVKLTQFPNSGEHRLYFRGDIISFKLQMDSLMAGKAFLRTNIGRASIRRKEIIEHINSKRAISSQDWHDVPMMLVSEREYEIDLSLLEVGHFEAIAFFLPNNEIEPIWPGSENVCINVEPAEYCCANSIYCAFPRQFGANKYYSKSTPIEGLTNEDMLQYDREGFTIIPPSGTFRDLINELDFITETLNCRIIHLLPVNPTPTVYARMGRYGSPYASLDFTDIDPSLAEFDKKATPLEQFMELVDAIHKRNAKLIIDVAINHVGWASKLHEEHPEWLMREKNGTIVCPGVWGVVWGDLTELDHSRPDLWEYLAKMFLTWTSRGVDGFRCDAGYMIPFEAWEYIIAKVRTEYPNTIFLLEGLGGDPKITFNLLNKANMNWAYSELFQNYSKQQIESYVASSHKKSSEDGLMVHYAETHDNSRMAAKSKTYAKMRTGLCALLSDCGGFGFMNGVEWFAEENVDVHEASALNWGSKENQVDFIKRLNSILISHSAFYRGAKVVFLKTNSNDTIMALRCCEDNRHQLLIVINLNCNKNIVINPRNIEIPEFYSTTAHDLITEKKFNLKEESLNLEPGEVLCLSWDVRDMTHVFEKENNNILIPDKIDKQRARAAALGLLQWKNGTNIVAGLETDNMGKQFLEDPERYCSTIFAKGEPVPLIHWNWPRDIKRKVIVPPNHLIMVSAEQRFRVTLSNSKKVFSYFGSLRSSKGEYFYILTPPKIKLTEQKTLTIKMSVYGKDKTIKEESELLFLTEDIHRVKTTLNNSDIRKYSGSFVDTNGGGGMIHANIEWGILKSKYDAFLAANLDKNVPVDRHVMFTRCRAWGLYQGRSVELKTDNIEAFRLNIDGGGTWDFHLPVGNGFYVDISIALTMIKNKNSVKMSVFRHSANGRNCYLHDSVEINLILRPDIEDRSFHNNTKIDDALRRKWEKAVNSFEKGFSFSAEPSRELVIVTTKGLFRFSPEYCYSIYYETEKERGMDCNGDLFSPGYFNINLIGGEQAEIIAEINADQEKNNPSYKGNINFKYLMDATNPLVDHVLVRAIKKFVVKRDNLKTVIAGYPWFLDWGRDTLICVRGMLSACMLDDVKKILMQFGKFSEKGTLPNIIQGKIVGNRDTSDAPLWFFVACSEYCSALGNYDILEEKVDEKRTLLEALKSIATGYINGTSNGIKVDPDSGLVFSPPHFTWMDTNYPAGTPREGYPIEIQALWYYALNFLGKIDKKEAVQWQTMAKRVAESVEKYYIMDYLSGNGEKTGKRCLSDCLHCSGFKPAKAAEKDDHIRPNQIFAIPFELVSDYELSTGILESSYELLIPGAMRSLADKPTTYPLPIYKNNSRVLLNDPVTPYWGEYSGDEDTRRKPSYHNGTAWSWPFPSYCEAYYKIYGKDGLAHARSILSSALPILEEGCLGQLPEVLDGNFPHKQKGCDAQAWSATEYYRVWKLLHS